MRREADRVAVLDEPLVRGAQLAVVDERDVGARAAHVEADRVLDSPHSAAMWRLAIAPAAMPEAARRTAKPLRPCSRRHHAAAGVQEQQVAVVAVVLEPLARAARRSRRRAARARRWRRSSRSARARRSRAAPRWTSRRARPAAPPRGSRACAARCRRVRVGVDEADRDRLDLAPAQDRAPTSRASSSSSGVDDLAGVVDALGHLEAVAAADVRRRDVLVGVPQVVACVPRRISITSRKPRVVTIAAGGKRRVISALVATVVPCENNARRRGRRRPPTRPPSRPPSGRGARWAPWPRARPPLSSSSTHTSVNVPPTSTATRILDTLALSSLSATTDNARRPGARPCVSTPNLSSGERASSSHARRT